ncbi:glycosyltransferase family 2 protein [Pseudonocardia sp. CA-107938]|uniref:glycosyltransferase family 2 protein n=1 Tax=Pseudonocardia sp. CA-107938 TaxID=3240021 RepID=UPI003D8D41FD
MRTAVITVVAGRHDHLRRQEQGLATGTRAPDQRIVVAIDDPGVAAALAGRPIVVVDHPTSPLGLPLAAARNAGAARALDGGAELLVFLDVDCIPGPDLVRRYAEVAARTDRRLLCGPVAYLPPAPDGGYPATGLDRLAAPHPARPAPADHETLDSADHELFWSLSFAVTAPVWAEIGGFTEAYVGYGGEDTDFGQSARAAGIGLRWVGGATAFHQHHPVSDPPREHLADILRNAAIFRRRWGWWPMTGWLTAFADAGLARYDPRTDSWAVTGHGMA